MHTLGMKTDGIITEFVKTKLSGEEVNAMSPTTDGRGRHVAKHKFDWNIIKQHINSYNWQISHYKRELAPNRLYLESKLTITDMWKDFCKDETDVCYELYRRDFTEEKITFGEPSHDECDVCLEYTMHIEEVIENHDANECEKCILAKSHLETAKKPRHEYQKELQDNVSAYAVDMQKVIILPKLSTKENCFISCLDVFNETFAGLKAGSPDYLALWHGGIAGRSAKNVTSTYVKCTVLDASPILFWADNCAGQNKNWTLFIAMVQTVNADWGPDVVTIKYLEKGHTYMKADSVHGSIGKKMKKCDNIFTFDDFVQLCNHASTVLMNFTSEQRCRKSKNKPDLPLLSRISEVKFTKGKSSLEYKVDFDDDVYTEVHFLKPKFDIKKFPSGHTEARGITKNTKR